MTKYILHAGGITNSTDNGARFFNEVIKGLGNNPKILFCFFAQPRERWDEKFQGYSQGFAERIDKSIEPSFDLAMPETFEKQINECDAIMIQGGDDHLSQYWLRQFNIPKIWEGKVVAGSSAGSDALSAHFWTADWRECMDGLGIVPVRFIPHFKSNYGSDDPRGPIDWDKVYKELEEYGDKSLPIHALKEGEFIVFDK
ncbi:hypothetical protein C4544_06225 [candidate division WS5 bacterium]|uniref:Peptidase E n=1 Tax=candidate division WS5 bacterium TaxID=2093353 RepID=A0A419DA38_9BACT|nr:MAG: hypothetical protein C4544_06225 [candidate division WS5 bacterium]